MENGKIESAPFLERLPLEIRLEIYRYLLSTEYIKNICAPRQVRSATQIPYIDCLYRFFGGV